MSVLAAALARHAARAAPPKHFCGLLQALNGHAHTFNNTCYSFSSLSSCQRTDVTTPNTATLSRGFRSSASAAPHNEQSQPPSSQAAAAAGGAAAAAAGWEPETPLLQAIRNRIMIRGGPLSVAEYMQEVLTNPVSGYYMKRDVFGSRGDFTTSPEISQMFGEVLGIWCVVAWQQLGCPSTLQLVELGPGRGTLMADLLRGTAAFKPFADALQVHLVEVSPFMRREQWKKLQCVSSSSSTINLNESSSSNSNSSSSSGSVGGDASSSSSRNGLSKEDSLPDVGVSELNGAQVSWHASLDAVPNAAPSIYIAHEFLDALPVHQFVRDPRRGWLEVMVDTVEDLQASDDSTPNSTSSSNTTQPAQQQSIDSIPLVQTQPLHLIQQQQQQSLSEQQGLSQSSSDQGLAPPPDQGLHLRFVLSPSPTPAAQLLADRRLEALGGARRSNNTQQPQQQQQQQGGQKQEQQQLQHAIEVGAQAMAVVEALSRRIAASGGAALLIDYGANKPYTNSLTAIRDHKGVHPLSQPGTADLSAWVDFSAMRMAAEQAFDIQPASSTAAQDGSSSSSSGGVGVGGGSDGSDSSGSGGGGGVVVFGPVTQEHLLHALGIQARLQSLAEAATPAQAEDLVSGYKRLTDTGPGGMGSSYLAMAITAKGMMPPVGFEQQQ